MASLSLTDIDFEAIEKCTDPKRLKKMLAMLKQDGGYYVELMKAAKDRIEKLTGKPVGGTPITAADKQAVAEELLAWEKKMAQAKEEEAASQGSPCSAAAGSTADSHSGKATTAGSNTTTRIQQTATAAPVGIAAAPGCHGNYVSTDVAVTAPSILDK
ncbi:uncharacterized protein LOC34618011 [Cyclospora cayetanensis]|uniref:Uncharacterized protein LOC34618011 n=1 Tax=Cyclospora cayetanensis TaxID=88456 RepID=A0A6P6RS12_9EIME|nr:uncharacterized protein LOC34618011 [Cyclospora cayetanensis]